MKEELAQARRDVELARNKGDYTRAGELMHATVPDLEQKVHDLEEQEQHEGKKKSKILAEAVTAEEVATIVARHTGIPVSRITGSESAKLLHMEDTLRQRVVGQDHALEAVSNCVRLARTRLQAEDRTLGNFLLVGPSGVGKVSTTSYFCRSVLCSCGAKLTTILCSSPRVQTELCKALAESMFDDPSAMTRIDMSEFGEKHTVSREFEDWIESERACRISNLTPLAL